MKQNFNDFRFKGLCRKEIDSRHLTMNRVSPNRNRIVVSVPNSRITEAKYGHALILDRQHVLFVKEWAIDQGEKDTEVLLTREYFIPKRWGSFEKLQCNEDALRFSYWVSAAEEQQRLRDEKGNRLFPVRWSTEFKENH